MDKKIDKILAEIKDTLKYVNEQDPHINEAIEQILKFKDKKIICVAAGRMGYSLRAFAMRLMHLGFNNVSFIGDTNVPFADENTLLIFNTSSGNTLTNVLYAEIAKARISKATVLTITENSNSDIIEFSDFYISLNDPTSIQPMKTRSEQATYIFFDYLVLRLMESLNISNESLVNNHSILE